MDVDVWIVFVMSFKPGTDLIPSELGSDLPKIHWFFLGVYPMKPWEEISSMGSATAQPLSTKA